MDHQCCYKKQFGASYIIFLLYVHEMSVVGSNIGEINKLKIQLYEEYEMKDLGPTKLILGFNICKNRTEGFLTLSEEKYYKNLACNMPR